MVRRFPAMFILHYYIFTFLFVFSRSSPVKETPRADVEYRLPPTVRPQQYKLILALSENVFTSLKFNGVLDLTISTTDETSEIKIHGNELDFSKITLTKDDNTENLLENTAGPYEIDSVTDILTLKSIEPLVIGAVYNLHFEYTATLRTDDMYGLYRSQYTENGVQKFLATTQFQTTYARRVFPCFDEPSFKATFLITIVHPEKYNAIGNTPLIKNETLGGVTTSTFKKTPIMSTYLVAFVISEFTCDKSNVQPEDLIDVPHRICSSSQTASDRQLALDRGPKILKELEEFTNVKYNVSGIGKIDQIAIPDFAAGAMENWGLATYRETALLWNEKESSNRYKQRVETVVAHELAHMWFGDLVTTHWWSDTFLNEGFATYFEYMITAKVEPDWQLEKQFVIEELQAFLASDSLATSAPLHLKVNSPSEVSARFGSVSYNKGGSIFRMVEHMMGTDNFKQGLTRYLTTYKLKNTQPDDLWNSLQEFATVSTTTPLTVLMKNWIALPGYPVLEVEKIGSDINISQKRFYTDGTIPKDTEKWYVPISYTLSGDAEKFTDTSPKRILQPNSDLVIHNLMTDDQEWIVLNNQQTGYYRVKYSDELLNRIINVLNNDVNVIAEINRAHLVDDLYNFAKANMITYTDFLNLISFIKKDVSYFAWYPTLTAFTGMLQRIGDAEISKKLNEYIEELITDFYNTVSFNVNKDDDQIYTHAKVLALNWGCRVGISDCITTSINEFNTYKTSGIKPNKNVRSTVYCNGLRHSSNIEDDWQFLWDEYKKADLATEQVTVLTALGCARDPIILKNYLRMSITAGEGIRQQDALSVFSAVYSGNPDGVDIAAEFLYENHQAISNFYGAMNSKSSLMNGLASRFTKQEQLDKLEEFLKNEEVDKELLTAAGVAHTNSKANLNITKRLENELTSFFTTSTSTSTSTPTSASTASPTSTSTTASTDSPDSSSSLNVDIMVVVLLASLHTLALNI